MRLRLDGRALAGLAASAARAATFVLIATCSLVTAAQADSVRVGSEAEVVSDDGVNLRARPDTSSKVVSIVNPTHVVYVLEGPESSGLGSWYKVEYDGDVGWVLGEYLGSLRDRTLSTRGDRRNDSTTSSWTPSIGREATVNTDGLNLRSAPGTDSKVIAVAGQTRYVYVVDGPQQASDGAWYKVDYDGDLGWVLGSYLGPAVPRQAVAPSRAPASAPRPAAPSRPAPAPVLAPPGDGSVGAAIAQRALQMVGSPYAWGGSSPRTGFDCSGLVAYVTNPFGIYPGRTSDAQAGAGRSVTGGELQLGDIVVFANTYAGGYSHTGIYVGNGRFVHAEDYGTGVIVSSVYGGYWGRHYVGARRVT